MSDNAIVKHVLENAKLCADRGWKGTFRYKSGDFFENAYITGTNWEVGVVKAERVGERNLEPRIIHLEEISAIEVIWS